MTPRPQEARSAARGRLVPRQKIGAPLMVALACFCSVGAGRGSAIGDWAGFALSLFVAVDAGLLALAFALIKPDEKELREVRAKYDKKIARLESRRP